MDDAEHGVAAAGEILRQRRVRARQAGVAVLQHEQRKSRRRGSRRDIEPRMGLDGGEIVEHGRLTHQLRKTLRLGHGVHVGRLCGARLVGGIPRLHFHLMRLTGGAEHLRPRRIGDMP